MLEALFQLPYHGMVGPGSHLGPFAHVLVLYLALLISGGLGALLCAVAWEAVELELRHLLNVATAFARHEAGVLHGAWARRRVLH